MINDEEILMEEKELEKKLVELLGKQKLFLWDNYALGQDRDLNEVDQSIYNLLKNIDPKNFFKGRKKEIFERLYYKLMIENDPEIAVLKNKLDNNENYNNKLDKNDVDYKIKIAKRKKEDVIQLMKLRNKKAKNCGFNSYPDFNFYYEELHKETVIKMIKKYLEDNINKANDLINEYDLTWQNWFERLRNIGSIEKQEPSYHFNCLLKKLDLNINSKDIKFKTKKDGISGMTFNISIPDDIRILSKPITSPMTGRVFFHECGHAINYVTANDNGIYNIYNPFHDEAVAIIFENIGIQLCMNKKEEKIAEEVKFLETIRCSISFLFEMELWKKPDQAEELFLKYQYLLNMKHNQKEIWELNSFRYIDPVYIQNYVLGEIYANRIIDSLNNNYNDNYIKWGQEIYDYFLKDAMKKGFKTKYKEFNFKLND